MLRVAAAAAAAGNWRNVAVVAVVMAVLAVHPIPNSGHLLATTMNIVVTIEMIVRAVCG